jgi:hypothetical protein
LTVFDQLQHVLGDFENLQSQLHLQRPTVQIVDPSTKAVVETTTSNVPDLIFATATLPASTRTQAGASVLLRFRRGQTFPGEAPLTITIAGERGEIKLVAEGGSALHASGHAPVTIRVHDFVTDKVDEVGWKWADWQEELPLSARSVGAVYEAYVGDGKGVASFEDATVRHEQLDGMMDAWAKKAGQ